MTLKIGDLAQATGTNAPTIRYYEDIGLLPHPSRVGGQRRYDDTDVRRLTFIRRCRDFGFPIDQVRTLTALTQDDERPCAEARELAEQRLAAVREKLLELRALERSLTAFIDTAEIACPGGTSGADCVLLDELAAP
jgi:DNA-binding transcriptional MerR regulator